MFGRRAFALWPPRKAQQVAIGTRASFSLALQVLLALRCIGARPQYLINDLARAQPRNLSFSRRRPLRYAQARQPQRP